MKQILVALVLTIICQTGTEAQTKSSQNNKCCACNGAVKLTAKAKPHQNKVALAKKSPVVKNTQYQVCEEKGGYYVCCVHNATAVVKK